MRGQSREDGLLAGHFVFSTVEFLFPGFQSAGVFTVDKSRTQKKRICFIFDGAFVTCFGAF